MDLYQVIINKYPGLKVDMDFTLKDDGQGPYILSWTNDNPQPTVDEINAEWELVEFERAVSDKKAELNLACSQAILGKFSADVNGITYYFSNDSEAQSNFKDTKALFDDGTIDAMAGGIITWTAYDTNGKVCRIPLNKDQFKPVNIARVMHQNNNVSKLRDDLEKRVDAATSLPEVLAITWEGN